MGAGLWTSTGQEYVRGFLAVVSLLWITPVFVRCQAICGDVGADCQNVKSRSFENAAWNASDYLLPTPSGPPVESLDDCCAMCSQTPFCILFDYTVDQQLCNMYNYSIYTQNSDMQGALVATRGTVASFLKTKVLFGTSFFPVTLGETPVGVLSDERLANLVGKDPSWCAQQCVVLCNCKFWTWEPGAIQGYTCSLFSTAAKPKSTVYVVAVSGIVTDGLANSNINLPAPSVVLKETYPYDFNKTYFNTAPDGSKPLNVTTVDYTIPWQWTVTTKGIGASAGWEFNYPLRFILEQAHPDLVTEIFSMSPDDLQITYFPTEDTSQTRGVQEGGLTLPLILASDSVSVPAQETHNYNFQFLNAATVLGSFNLTQEIGQCAGENGAVDMGELEEMPLAVVLEQRVDLLPLLSCFGMEEPYLDVAGELRMRLVPLEPVTVALANDIPDTQVGVSFPTSLSGQCLPAETDWQTCREECTVKSDCVAWTWQGLSSICPWGVRCDYHSAVGDWSAAAPTLGAMSGVIPVAEQGKCNSLVGMELVPGVTNAAEVQVIPTSSSQKCCKACTMDSKCSGYTFFQSDRAGGCQLLTGQIASARPTAGALSAIMADREIPQPALALGHSTLLQQLDAFQLSSSWSDICCFNNLLDCSSANPTQSLLIPRAKQAVDTSSCIGLSGKKNPVAVTKSGCACSVDAVSPSVDGLRVSGACVSGKAWGTDTKARCVVSDAIQCPVLASSSNTDECDESEEKKGCMLIPAATLSGSFSAIVAGGSSKTRTAAECCQLCSVLADCMAFTFVSQTGVCTLLSSVTGSIIDRQVLQSDASQVMSGLTMRQSDYLVTSIKQGKSIRSDWPHGMKPGRRLKAVDFGSVAWQQVCCFNNLSKEECDDASSESYSLVVPLSDAPIECAATESGSSNNTAAITIGAAVGAGIVALAAALALALFALMRWRKKRRTQVQDALNREALLKHDALPKDELPKNIAASPVVTSGEYEWHSCFDGRNSTVLLGRHIEKDRSVAAKFFKQHHAFVSAVEFNTAVRDSKCHPEFYSVCDPPSNDALPCILMEAGSYTLTDHIVRSAQRPSSQHCKAILQDLCEALHGLHKNGVVHNDVKPDNLLWFSEQHRWKLTDFGSWARTGNKNRPNFTLKYAAPEVVTKMYNDEPVVADPAVDMWSVGVLGWEIFTGEPLFGEQYSDEDIQEMLVNAKKLPFEAKPGMWEAVNEQQTRRMLQALLSRDPQERWTAERVLNSAVFKAGLTEEQELAEYAAVNKQITEITNRVVGLKEVSIQSLKANTGQALMLNFTLEKVKSNTLGSGVGMGSGMFKRFTSGKMTGTLDDEDETEGFLAPAMTSRPFFAKDMRSTDLVDMDTKVLKGELSTVEAPLSLGSVFGMDPVFLMHQGSVYVVRLELKFGEAQSMELPVSTVDEIVLSYTDADDEKMNTSFEVTYDYTKSNDYEWHGFAIWSTDDVPLGRKSLTVTAMCRLKGAQTDKVEISKNCVFDFQPAGTSFTVETAAADIQKYWDEAPDWMKLGVKGMSCVYSWSMGG